MGSAVACCGTSGGGGSLLSWSSDLSAVLPEGQGPDTSLLGEPTLGVDNADELDRGDMIGVEFEEEEDPP